MRNLWVLMVLGSIVINGHPLLANVTGSELQNFNAAYTSVDGATVHSARTMGRGRLGLGLFGNNAVNTLPYFNQEGISNIDQKKDFNDSVTGMEVLVSYGITSFWDFSLALPSIVAQTVENNSALHGYFGRLGIIELRFATKLNLVDTELFALGIIGTANLNRVQNNPYSGNETWPAFSLELLGTLNLGLVTWNNNLGYRKHNGQPDAEITKILPFERFGDQWVASSGVILDLPATDLDILGEVYGSHSRTDFSSFSPRNSSVLEGLVGLRYPINEEWQLHGGYSSEMRHSISSADYRIYAGVRWMTDMSPAKVADSTPAPAPIAPAAFLVMEPSITSRPPDAIIELDDIYFHFDATTIRDPNGYAVMEQLKSSLQSNRGIERVVIEGHACSMGSDAYNFELSDRRAETIERWLVQTYGVGPEKLVTVGWGERHPKISNRSEEGRMLNRRVTFKIYYELSRPPVVAPATAGEALQAH